MSGNIAKVDNRDDIDELEEAKAMTKHALVVAATVVLLATPAAVLGQGQGKGQGQDPGQSQTKGQQSNPPPSKSDLLTPAVGQSAAFVTPFAWIDDATLLDPRTVSIAVSIVRWSGSGASEVDAPVIDLSIGVSRRVHLTATIPRVVGGDEPFGAAGGAGTSYVGAKVALLDPTKHRIKFTVSPMIEVLGRGVVETADTGQRRLHMGVPASAEIDSGPARFYAGAGFFSRGIWFMGGGVGFLAASKIYVSMGYNTSWRTADAADVPISGRSRNEVTASLAYVLAPKASVYGSIGRTMKTLDENGAGRTIGGGVAFSFAPAIK
jgi:hypothetical protein